MLLRDGYHATRDTRLRRLGRAQVRGQDLRPPGREGAREGADGSGAPGNRSQGGPRPVEPEKYGQVVTGGPRWSMYRTRFLGHS